MRRAFGSRAGRTAPILTVVLPLACGDAAPPPDAGDAENAAADAATPVAPARYVTQILFASFDGPVLLGSFAQETDGRRLAREYEAWWTDGDGWTRGLVVADTLPLPRAEWRILPAAGLTVRAGDSREVVGLRFGREPGSLSLRSGEEVAAWTGPTGQRESLGLAALARVDTAWGGILLFRRAARATRFDRVPGASPTFVLADSAGNGILIERPSDPAAPVIARTWLHGSADAWDEVALGSPDPDARLPIWEFSIPGAGLRGVIRAVEPEMAGDGPARRVECELVSGEDTFRFQGLMAPLPLP